jgi:hypothetical protein
MTEYAGPSLVKPLSFVFIYQNVFLSLSNMCPDSWFTVKGNFRERGLCDPLSLFNYLLSLSHFNVWRKQLKYTYFAGSPYFIQEE